MASDDRGRLEQIGTAIAFLGRLDYRNLRMLPRTLGILGRPAAADWWYNRDLVARELPKAVRNLVVAPSEMGSFQRHCPVAGYVSTPVDGLLAGFTHQGRMSTLLYPHTGFTQQLHYFETGGEVLNGARPREGAFWGVETADERWWLWGPAFGHEMRPGAATGSLEIDYAGADAPVEAAEVAYVRPESETVVRDLELRTTGEERVERVLYYMAANANANQQYPPGVSSPNRAIATDRGVRWTDRESDVDLQLLAGSDSSVAATGVADAPLESFVETASAAAVGRHVSGYVALDVDLDPGESTTVSVFTAGETGADPAGIDDPAADRQAAAGAWWDDHLSAAPVEAVDDRFADQYERSLVGLLKLYDPASGSISAAPNVQPAYYPSWPRDGAFAAIALAEAGFVDAPQGFLARFLGSVQEPDGGFEQCYTSDGAPAGIIVRENDQQGIHVHAVRAVYEATGDEAFVREAWPTVEASLEYLRDAVTDNGLLEATPDFAEMPSHARQSLWTNAFAYRGLLDGAALAAVVGADPEPYREAAARIGDAVERAFFEGREAFATVLTIRGTERDANPAFATAVHPTGWAADHDRLEEVVEGCIEMHGDRERVWLPREFIYAATLYATGREERADRILDDLRTEHLDGGTLAEEVDASGDHRFAALGWANAAFVHAVHVREGLAAETG